MSSIRTGALGGEDKFVPMPDSATRPSTASVNVPPRDIGEIISEVNYNRDIAAALHSEWQRLLTVISPVLPTSEKAAKQFPVADRATLLGRELAGTNSILQELLGYMESVRESIAL